MPKKAATARKGRPEIEIDTSQVERLAQIQCTDEEMAAVLGCSHDTLARRKADDPAFLDALTRGKAKGRMALRRLQWQRANGGSDTMLIWLGKQLLGQRDKQDHELSGPGGGPVLTVITGVPRPTDT